MSDSPDRRNPEVAYEHSDVRSFAVTATGIALLLGTLTIAFLLWFVFEYFRSTHAAHEPRPALAPEYSNIRQPLLQTSPRTDLQELRARDDRLLNHYTWADRSKGTVSIPVDRSIDKLVSEGMPAQADYSDLKLFPPHSGTRDTGFDLVNGGDRQ